MASRWSGVGIDIVHPTGAPNSSPALPSPSALHRPQSGLGLALPTVPGWLLAACGASAVPLYHLCVYFCAIQVPPRDLPGDRACALPWGSWGVSRGPARPPRHPSWSFLPRLRGLRGWLCPWAPSAHLSSPVTVDGPQGPCLVTALPGDGLLLWGVGSLPRVVRDLQDRRQCEGPLLCGGPRPPSEDPPGRGQEGQQRAA